ncbi:MAG: DoxX family protein [Bacteroidales bacterium]|nr:DoxX family protein [Bacteroidales bacterium]
MMKFLFPGIQDNKKLSAVLLVLRMLFGLFLAYHGLTKMLHFGTLSTQFPDPLGIGTSLSLSMAIFGELFCSLAFIFGFLFRLSTIPIIFTMIVAYYVSRDELALVYLISFIIVYIAGPGKYALDTLIANYFSKR